MGSAVFSLCLSLPVVLSLLFLSQCDCAVGLIKDSAGVGSVCAGCAGFPALHSCRSLHAVSRVGNIRAHFPSSRGNHLLPFLLLKFENN